MALKNSVKRYYIQCVGRKGSFVQIVDVQIITSLEPEGFTNVLHVKNKYR